MLVELEYRLIPHSRKATAKVHVESQSMSSPLRLGGLNNPIELLEHPS